MEGQICKVLARCGTGLQAERRKGHGPTSCIAPLSMHEVSPGRNANADTPGYPEAQGAKGRPQLKGHTQQRARNLCAVEASIWAWLRKSTDSGTRLPKFESRSASYLLCDLEQVT